MISKPHLTMDYTGERMVPEKAEPEVYWEHIYRYRFAVPFVKGKRVLDIACGEGYGTAAIQQAGAASVIGVDISEETCRHAQQKYGVDARVGDAEQIPIPDESVDIVVSFETIEHVPDPGKFLDECLRVLAPGGTLIVSTPNKDIYRVGGVQNNPHHCSEMTEDEFVSQIKARFSTYDLYGQHIKAAPLWSFRSVIGLYSPWSRKRGFGRLLRAIRNMFCPHVNSAPDEQRRLSSVQEIGKHESFLAMAFNPYTISKKSKSSQEQMVYVLAVARK